jgi:Tol biopolymer transport system component
MRLSGASRRIVPGVQARDPAWSPGGRWLAAVRWDENQPWGEVIIVRRDGSGLRELGEGSGVRWSTGGRIAAITRPVEADGVGSNVVLINPVTGARSALFPGGAPTRRLFSVDWSPAGDRLVLAGTVRGTPAPGVFVVAADGSGFRRLSAARGRDGSFTFPAAIWSPDGRRIAFGNSDSVFTIRADAREPVPLGSWRRVVRNAQLVDWQARSRRPRFAG